MALRLAQGIYREYQRQLFDPKGREMPGLGMGARHYQRKLDQFHHYREQLILQAGMLCVMLAWCSLTVVAENAETKALELRKCAERLEEEAEALRARMLQYEGT